MLKKHYVTNHEAHVYFPNYSNTNPSNITYPIYYNYIDVAMAPDIAYDTTTNTDYLTIKNTTALSIFNLMGVSMSTIESSLCENEVDLLSYVRYDLRDYQSSYITIPIAYMTSSSEGLIIHKYHDAIFISFYYFYDFEFGTYFENQPGASGWLFIDTQNLLQQLQNTFTEGFEIPNRGQIKQSNSILRYHSTSTEKGYVEVSFDIMGEIRKVMQDADNNDPDIIDNEYFIRIGIVNGITQDIFNVTNLSLSKLENYEKLLGDIILYNVNNNTATYRYVSRLKNKYKHNPNENNIAYKLFEQDIIKKVEGILYIKLFPFIGICVGDELIEKVNGDIKYTDCKFISYTSSSKSFKNKKLNITLENA